MKNKNVLLLRTLLLSTSPWNKLKYCKDRKKRGQAIGNLIGMSVLYLLLLFYCVMTCIGYGIVGLTEAVPAMCALVISIMAFFLTIFKTNGYLFHFKEYDMLMSLPFEAKNVAGMKFLYMYVKNLPWYVSISLAMLIGYGIFAAPPLWVYPLWLLLSFFLPVIPMLAAAFVGFLIARISAGFRQTNLIQTVLVMVFVMLCMSVQFILPNTLQNLPVEVLLESISEKLGEMGNVYWPMKWFADGVTKGNVIVVLLLVGVSVVLFEVIFIVVGGSYRKINSAMQSHSASKNYRMTGQKQKDIRNTIAFKEFRRLLGSTVYMTNAALGEVLTLIVGIAVLAVGIEPVIETVTQGAPVSKEMLYPAIPLIIYMLIGMVATTACTPSLEGKNYWILQSLPIEKKVIYQGKMLFNLYLTVPFALFGVICFCISAKTPFVNALLYAIEEIVLCCFSTAWGCVCGIRFRKLDWENEVEVVKQGAAVSVYLLPNLFGTMILLVAVVAAGLVVNPNLLTILFTLIMAGLAALCYGIAMKLAEKVG